MLISWQDWFRLMAHNAPDIEAYQPLRPWPIPLLGAFVEACGWRLEQIGAEREALVLIRLGWLLVTSKAARGLLEIYREA